MAYNKTNWRDTIKDNDGNIIEKGTPLASTNLNKMEDGIANATEKAEKAEGDLVKVSQQLAETDRNLSLGLESKANKVEVEGTNRRIDELVIESGDANAEVTDAHVSVSKNKSFDTLRNRFEDIERDTFFPMANYINSDYLAEKNNHWILTDPYIKGVNTVENGTLIVTGDGTVTTVGSKVATTGLAKGNTVYYKAQARVTNPNAIRLRFRAFQTGLDHIIQSPTADKWYDFSGIIKQASGSLDIFASYENAGTALGKATEIRCVVGIDLTATFGAGNEPTLEQMNEIMKRFPNSWFSGRVNLFNANTYVKRAFHEIELENNVRELQVSADKNLAHWVPDTMPDSNLKLSYADFITNTYESLRTAHPESIKREVIINDESGSFPIYEYSLTPSVYKHSIFITAGIHGNEPESYWGLYYFLNEVYNNNHTNEKLRYLRENVRFVVIPVVSPWGYANFTRANVNGINANRNFDVFWGTSSSEGATPFSENEALAVKNVLDKYKAQFDIAFDFHTVPAEYQNYDRWGAYVYVRPESKINYPLHTVQEYLIKHWNNVYSKSLATLYNTNNNSTTSNYLTTARNIPAATLEFVTGNFSAVLADSKEITRAVEWYGNAIIESVNYIIKTKNEGLMMNHVLNGDFSKGTEGWWTQTYFGNTLSVNQNTLIITGDGTQSSTGAIVDPVPLVSGHKLYTKASARVTNNTATHISLRFYTPSEVLQRIDSPVENKWYNLSGVVTHNGKRPEIYTSYADAATANGKVLEIRHVMILDLTEIFGEGLEPTTAEMDELLRYFPNAWFDENTPVSEFQKALMAYTFNNIRMLKGS